MSYPGVPSGLLFLAASRVSLSKSESKESVTKLGRPSGTWMIFSTFPTAEAVG
jgi:hypothetical protein